MYAIRSYYGIEVRALQESHVVGRDDRHTLRCSELHGELVIVRLPRSTDSLELDVEAIREKAAPPFEHIRCVITSYSIHYTKLYDPGLVESKSFTDRISVSEILQSLFFSDNH